MFGIVTSSQQIFMNVGDGPKQDGEHIAAGKRWFEGVVLEEHSCFVLSA